MADSDADSQVSSTQYQFLFKLNESGGKVAYDNDLPVPAMLACAAAESGWGSPKNAIFQATGCHFNLQKPSWYTWMKCRTVKLKTDGQGLGTLVWVDFCAADTWADSVGLWCTWILNYPHEGHRNEVLAARHSPRDFCAKLPKVGFGPQNAAAWKTTAKGYLDVYDQFQLGGFAWTAP